MYTVAITAAAERDILSAYQWWCDNRSAEQAQRWLDSIYPAIDSLDKKPLRCPRAEAAENVPGEVRQLLFGIGRRPTHKILFEVDGNRVLVLSVRHVARQT